MKIEQERPGLPDACATSRSMPGGVARGFLTLEPWTIDNGLITLTMKLKWTMIERSFAEEIVLLNEGHAMNKDATIITSP